MTARLIGAAPDDDGDVCGPDPPPSYGACRATAIGSASAAASASRPSGTRMVIEEVTAPARRTARRLPRSALRSGTESPARTGSRTTRLPTGERLAGGRPGRGRGRVPERGPSTTWSVGRVGGRSRAGDVHPRSRRSAYARAGRSRRSAPPTCKLCSWPGSASGRSVSSTGESASAWWQTTARTASCRAQRRR